MRRPRAAAIALLLAAAPPAAAEPGPPPRPAVARPAAEPGVDPGAEAALFAMPAIAAAGREAAARLDAGDLAGAAAILDRTAAANPEAAAVPLMQAELALLAGDAGAALDALARAANLGADVRAALDDPRLADPGTDPRRAALLARPAPAPAGAGPRPGDRRPRPGLGRQHRLEPGRASGWSRASPSPRSPTARCCRRRRRPPPRHPARALEAAAAPPATSAISTTTATAAIRRSKPAAFPQLAHVAYSAGRPRRRPRLRPQRPARSSTARPSATPRPRSPAARSGAACRASAMTQRRRHRPAPALAERRSATSSTSIPAHKDYDARARRPLPGQHPLSPRLAAAPRARTSRSSRRWR